MKRVIKFDAEPVPRMGVALVKIVEQSHAGAYFAAEQYEPFRHGKVQLSSGILSTPPGLYDELDDGKFDLSVHRLRRQPGDERPFTIPLEWMEAVLDAAEQYSKTDFPEPPPNPLP